MNLTKMRIFLFLEPESGLYLLCCVVFVEKDKFHSDLHTLNTLNTLNTQLNTHTHHTHSFSHSYGIFEFYLFLFQFSTHTLSLCWSLIHTHILQRWRIDTRDSSRMSRETCTIDENVLEQKSQSTSCILSLNLLKLCLFWFVKFKFTFTLTHMYWRRSEMDLSISVFCLLLCSLICNLSNTHIERTLKRFVQCCKSNERYTCNLLIEYIERMNWIEGNWLIVIKSWEMWLLCMINNNMFANLILLLSLLFEMCLILFSMLCFRLCEEKRSIHAESEHFTFHVLREVKCHSIETLVAILTTLFSVIVRFLTIYSHQVKC
jgi:hypothetical protein